MAKVMQKKGLEAAKTEESIRQFSHWAEKASVLLGRAPPCRDGAHENV